MSRNLGCVRTQSELVNIQYFASDDRWETVALDGAISRQEADISDAEKERDVSCKNPVASSQNGVRSPCHSAEGDRGVDDAGAARVPTLRNVPGRLSQKALDEQASMKMSHRYYISGVDSNRRRSIPGRAAAESGKEDTKHCSRKRNEKAEAEYTSKIRKSATNEVYSVKELAESYTSDDSNCSDAEDGKSSSRHYDEDAEVSFREMILQKYLVMLPGKAKKMQSSMVRASADTKQKEGQCKIKTGKPHCRKPNGKTLHSVSPSRRQKFQLRKSPKKNPYPGSEAPHTRQSVSQPQKSNNIRAAEAPREEEQLETGKKSSWLVASLKKAWSTGDLHHSKSLGDIGALKGHALTHRDVLSHTETSEQEKRAIDFQLRLAKDSKVSLSDASQAMTSGERCFAMEKLGVEKICPQHTVGQNNFTNFCIRSVEVSTASADPPLTKISDVEGENAALAVRPVPCGCLNPPSVQGASKTQLSSQLSGAMEGAEYEWQGRVAEQGLSALALFPGPAETSENPLKSSTDDPSVLLFMGTGGVGGTHWIHENPMAKKQVKLHSKGAEESSDGGSTHRQQAKSGKGADESKNGISKRKFLVKKVNTLNHTI